MWTWFWFTTPALGIQIDYLLEHVAVAERGGWEERSGLSLMLALAWGPELEYYRIKCMTLLLRVSRYLHPVWFALLWTSCRNFNWFSEHGTFSNVRQQLANEGCQSINSHFSASALWIRSEFSFYCSEGSCLYNLYHIRVIYHNKTYFLIYLLYCHMFHCLYVMYSCEINSFYIIW